MEVTEATQAFNRLASDEQIGKTVEALEANGIHTLLFETGEEARAYVISIIPSGAQVYNPPSQTINQVGLSQDIENATDFNPVRARLSMLDREKQQREIRAMVASPDVVIGSVQAITEKGEVLLASATGSQISSVAAGAGAVIWVAGTQKLVSTLEEGFRRIREHCYPLEDQRTRQVYGQPSAVNKILIVNGERPGRITMILVKQNLGF